MSFFNEDSHRPNSIFDVQMLANIRQGESEAQIEELKTKFLWSMRDVLNLAFPYDEEEKERVKDKILNNLEIAGQVYHHHLNLMESIKQLRKLNNLD